MPPEMLVSPRAVASLSRRALGRAPGGACPGATQWPVARGRRARVVVPARVLWGATASGRTFVRALSAALCGGHDAVVAIDPGGHKPCRAAGTRRLAALGGRHAAAVAAAPGWVCVEAAGA